MSNPAVQAAALQHHWPLSLLTQQFKLLHCNTTGHSQVQNCSKSCCIATLLATLTSNPPLQAAALQHHHWPLSRPLSRPTLQSLPNSIFYLYVCLEGNERSSEIPNSLYVQGPTSYEVQLLDTGCVSLLRFKYTLKEEDQLDRSCEK
jgi:hypothetical protein